jgi:DNA-binding beta-propeller fold protein YncE
MQKQLALSRTVAASSALLLAACGSGGDASPTAPSSGGGPISSPVVYVANSVSNDVSAYRLDDATGALAAVPGSPFAAGVGPTSIAVSPSGRVVLVAHATSQDVWAYTRDAAGALRPVGGGPFPVGNGPLRALAFDPGGRFAYVAGDGITTLTVDPASGALERVAGSPFTDGQACSKGPSAVVASRQGVVYSATLGCISTLKIDATSGALSAIRGSPEVYSSRGVLGISPEGGHIYTSLAFRTGFDVLDTWYIDGESKGLLSALIECSSCAPPDFHASGDVNLAVVAHPSNAYWVYATTAARDTGAGALHSFHVDLSSDQLIGTASASAGRSPQGLAADPDGHYVFVASAQNIVQGYSVDATSGAAMPVAGALLPAGDHPVAVAISRPPHTP